MSDYPIEIKIRNNANGEVKIYHLRQCNALEDDSLVEQLKTPYGKPNDKEIWIARFIRDYQGMDEKKVREMKRWEKEILAVQWLKFNDITSTNFLEEVTSSGEGSKDSTSSPLD